MATNWETSRPDRSEYNRCGFCGNTTNSSCHTGRSFQIALCHPGTRHLGHDPDGILDGHCRATVETRYEWDFSTPDTRHRDVATRTGIVYRGACLGCGWAGPARPDDENAAVEDAHDHTLPLWRNAPIIERHHHDANNPAVTKWARDVAAIYTAYGLDRSYTPAAGGLIRTLRQQHGTRSHHVAALGYYDISAGHRPARTPLQRNTTEPTLFS